MLIKILAKFETTLTELETFISEEVEAKKLAEETITGLKAVVEKSAKDIAKAGRVKGKITKLIS